MRKAVALLVLLVPTTFAGCLAGDADPAGCPSGAADHPDTTILAPTQDPIVDEHDHWDWVPHAVRTCSIIAISHDTLTGTEAAHKYIGEIDTFPDRDLAAIVVLVAAEGDPGIQLVDIADRASPVPLSFIPTPGFTPVDVKFSVDGQLLYVATQRTLRLDERILDGPAEQVGSNGVLAYRIDEPEAPVLAGSTLRLPGGCHMVRPVIVDGIEWLWCAWEGFWAMTVVRDGDNVRFGPPLPYFRDEEGLATPTAPAMLAPTIGAYVEGAGHLDMQFHDDGERTIMLASHWDSGLRIVDLSPATGPQELARWEGEGANHYHGNVHSADVVETSAGRFIIASPELTSEDTVPSLWILDAADWSAPRLVAEFTAQGEHPSQDLTFTIHQWQVAPQGPDVDPDDVRIYMTYNHAGVWVLSLGDILAGDNVAAVRGFHLARAALDEETLPGRAYLGSWDVGLVDGHIYATDRATGLWTLHYVEDALGDPRLTHRQ